jgi:hypothetical protein
MSSPWYATFIEDVRATIRARLDCASALALLLSCTRERAHTRLVGAPTVHVMHHAAAAGHVALLEWSYTRAYPGAELSPWAMISAVENNRLDALVWLHKHQCPSAPDIMYEVAAKQGNVMLTQWLDVHTYVYTNHLEHFITIAATYGHLACVQWFASRQFCNMGLAPVIAAVEHGHLHVLQWLRPRVWARSRDRIIMCMAAESGHLHIMQWLLEQEYVLGPFALLAACAHGNVDHVNWLHVNGSMERDARFIAMAAAHGHEDVVQWLRHHGYPAIGNVHVPDREERIHMYCSHA